MARAGLEPTHKSLEAPPLPLGYRAIVSAFCTSHARWSTQSERKCQVLPLCTRGSLGEGLFHRAPPLQRRRKTTDAKRTMPSGRARRLMSTPASSPPATPKEATTTSTPNAREERTERLCPVSASCCVLAARNPSAPSTSIMPKEKTAPNIHGFNWPASRRTDNWLAVSKPIPKRTPSRSGLA